MKREPGKLGEGCFDLLVVGAGIYGAFTALDAARRGLRTALIDRGDFGGGASANSLKIIHGGLRYLQSLDLKRMRESIRERSTLMRIAPHLVHPLPCLMPTYGLGMKSRAVMALAMAGNDFVSLGRNRGAAQDKRIPRGRLLSRSKVLELLPGIEGRGVTGGALWTDARVLDTERLTLSCVLSAVEEGVQAANYLTAESLILENGKVNGVRARDRLTGESLEIRASQVVNTCGGWVDSLLPSSRQVFAEGLSLSKAMNLVIDRDALPGPAAGLRGAYAYSLPGGGVHRGRRFLFFAPWNGKTLVGTYHAPCGGSFGEPAFAGEEIDRFLEEVNSAWPRDPFRRSEVSRALQGFLPMQGVHPRTGQVILAPHYLLRDHRREGLRNLLTVVGVKYTTARDVAEKTVDLLFRSMGREPPACRTAELPIAGGDTGPFEDYLEGILKANREGQAGPEALKSLVLRRGTRHAAVLRRGLEDPSLLQRIAGSNDVLRAEVIEAAVGESAAKLEDTVLRRTGLGAAGHPGRAALEECAQLMAEVLGWSEERRSREVEETEACYCFSFSRSSGEK